MREKLARTTAKDLRRGDKFLCRDGRVDKVERSARRVGNRVTVRTNHHDHYFHPETLVEMVV